MAPQTASAAPAVYPETIWDQLRRTILQLGLLRTVLLGTLLVEIGSLALIGLLSWALGVPMWQGLAIATVCVLCTAPSVGYAGFKLLLELETARQHVQKLGSTDALTGIHNRRHFMLVAEREVEHAKRFATPLSFIALDIDHFKRINETHGHPCGDKVLHQIAQTCQGMLRETDTLAHFGRGEIMFLLPQTSAAGANTLAERLRTRVSSLVIEWRGEEIHPTVSLGVASRPFETTSLDALILDAEAALQDAKHQGRNQVCRALMASNDAAATPGERSHLRPVTPPAKVQTTGTNAA